MVLSYCLIKEGITYKIMKIKFTYLPPVHLFTGIPYSISYIASYLEYKVQIDVFNNWGASFVLSSNKGLDFIVVKIQYTNLKSRLRVFFCPLRFRNHNVREKLFEIF